MRRLTEPLDEFTEIYLDNGHSVALTGRFSLEANQKVCSRVAMGARTGDKNYVLLRMIKSHVTRCSNVLNGTKPTSPDI